MDEETATPLIHALLSSIIDGTSKTNGSSERKQYLALFGGFYAPYYVTVTGEPSLV